MSQVNNFLFSDNIRFVLNEWLEAKEVKEPVFICDENTAKFCFPLLGIDSQRLIVIPEGEANKNIDTLNQVLEQFLQMEVKRNDLIINLGGGVVCDLGGFAASIYRRGIRYINIPTTLLAMADAAIGGKTGIDYKNLKNYLGAFKLPEVVMFSAQFLETLPQEHIVAAKAEIIKTAAVCDAELFKMLEEGAPVEQLIHSCAHDKAMLVDKDFKDENARQLLNFGHTIGHALESWMLENGTPILHGMAIASGMLAELDIADQLGVISQQDSDRIRNLVVRLTNAKVPDNHEFNEFVSYLKVDKKNTSSKIVFSLPTGIGRGQFGIGLELSEIKR